MSTTITQSNSSLERGSWISFGRELCIATIEEVLPGLACTASIALCPVAATIAETAVSLFSIKKGVEEYRKNKPWTFHRLGTCLYQVNVGMLIGYQAFYPSLEGYLALGAIAVGTGMVKLYHGYQQIRQGLNNNEKSLARDLVTTIIASFNLASGLSRICFSLPNLIQKMRMREQIHLQGSRIFSIKGEKLFDSTIWGCEVDKDLAKSTLAVLQAKSAPGVHFSDQIILPWKGGGTCSARTLYFLSRHLKECSIDAPFAEQANCIASFEKYYRRGGLIFQSRQAAFDTISVDTNSSDPETLKTAKMASLAAFHNLKLDPMTKKSMQVDENTHIGICFEKSEIEQIYERSYQLIIKKDLSSSGVCDPENPDSLKSSEKTLMDIIQKLPFGRYLIRGIIPEDNHKQEHHGHSIALIKSKVGDFLFDPIDGAFSIIRDIKRHMVDCIRGHSVWYNQL